ncbi:LysE family translocator [Actinophytocola sp.]|uniref:LysE family translocator n=1 Tax=Actinophytocola sp. TaxID=1872138 RepID=UPI003899F8F8
MRSVLEFIIIAVVVTITPGPGTAAIIRITARDGRRAAVSAVIGNSIGVLCWAVLSAVGVSSLILASEVAYNVLRIAGAVFLIVLGMRSVMMWGQNKSEEQEENQDENSRPRLGGWRIGLLTSLSNPKLAVFFVALFPQFLDPGTAVLPYAVIMSVTIVALDLLWFATLIYLVDRARTLLRPHVRRVMERVTGGILVGLGAVLIAEG